MVVSTARMSIGAVSRAVGIPVGTLRNWERRYGVPSPDRTDGGHRLYGPETVGFLEMVNKAMRHGHRPAQLLCLSYEDLAKLISSGASLDVPDDVWGTGVSYPDIMSAIRQFDSDFLFSTFRTEVARAGLGDFVIERIAPLLKDLGVAWEEGNLSVEQEHFASEVIRDFLSAEWRALSSREGSVRVVCTTFPGEMHFLGLHMAASLLAVEGVRVLFLGSDIPLSGAQEAANFIQADAVVVSCSVFSDFEQNQTMLKRLIEGLSPHTEVWIGGAGIPTSIVGVRRFNDLGEFRRFVQAKVASATRD